MLRIFNIVISEFHSYNTVNSSYSALAKYQIADFPCQNFKQLELKCILKQISSLFILNSRLTES